MHLFNPTAGRHDLFLVLLDAWESGGPSCIHATAVAPFAPARPI